MLKEKIQQLFGMKASRSIQQIDEWMEEDRMSSRNVQIPIEQTEGFEFTEVMTNTGRKIEVINGMVKLYGDETIKSVKEKRKEDPAIYNPENLVGKKYESEFESVRDAVKKLEFEMKEDVYIVTTGESYAGVIQELSETYVKKNSDYGNSFEKTLDKRGLIPAIVRMEEKMERMEKLWDTEETLVEDEDIIDSAMDLANYAIMTAMWLKKKEVKTNNVEIWADDMKLE